MSVLVIDTNIILVANGQHSKVSPSCVINCVLALQEVMRSGKLILDEGFLILLEYQNKTQPKIGNRPGDAFVKWALNNRSNSKHVETVALVKHHERGFESFPDELELANFDVADRKFVAVSAAHFDKPSISQATDSKWLEWAPALKRCGIRVDFLCESDIQKFQKKKRTKSSKSTQQIPKIIGKQLGGQIQIELR